MKKSSKKIFLELFAGIALGFVIFEVSLQLISASEAGKMFPLVRPNLGHPDWQIGYNFAPGTEVRWTNENRALVKINSFSLRDNEYSQDAPPNTYRIALSGDSIVEALPVENEYTFENTAEKNLQERGFNLQILNFAMSGNGPLRQLVRLENHALKFNPDLYLMMITVGDFLSGELLNDTYHPAYKISDEGLIERSYRYRNRASLKYVDTFAGRSFLFIIRNFESMRMIYYLKDEPLRKILKIIRPSPNRKPLKTTCDNQAFEVHENLWIEKQHNKHYEIAKRFFSEASFLAQNKKLIIALDFPMPDEHCISLKKKREQILRELVAITRSYNIILVDWRQDVMDELIVQKDNYSYPELFGFGQSLGVGHLNYTGNKIYAKVLENLLVEHIK